MGNLTKKNTKNCLCALKKNLYDMDHLTLARWPLQRAFKFEKKLNKISVSPLKSYLQNIQFFSQFFFRLWLYFRAPRPFVWLRDFLMLKVSSEKKDSPCFDFRGFTWSLTFLNERYCSHLFIPKKICI